LSQKICDGCPLEGTDEEECRTCMGFLQMEDEIPNPFDFIDFKVLGASEEEMNALRIRFRDIVNSERNAGRLPKTEILLRLYLVRILQGVLRDHYSAY